MNRLGRWGRLGRLQVVLQTAECLLGSGQIARSQVARQALEIRVRLEVFAERLGSRGLGRLLQFLLKSGQGALGIGEITGLEGAADRLEILNQLADTARVGGWVQMGGRSHARNAAHIIRLLNWLWAARLPTLLGNG